MAEGKPDRTAFLVGSAPVVQGNKLTVELVASPQPSKSGKTQVCYNSGKYFSDVPGTDLIYKICVLKKVAGQ